MKAPGYMWSFDTAKYKQGCSFKLRQWHEVPQLLDLRSLLELRQKFSKAGCGCLSSSLPGTGAEVKTGSGLRSASGPCPPGLANSPLGGCILETNLRAVPVPVPRAGTPRAVSRRGQAQRLASFPPPCHGTMRGRLE